MQKNIDEILKILDESHSHEDFEKKKANLKEELLHIQNEARLVDFKSERARKDKHVLNSLLKKTSEDLKLALRELQLRADELNTLLSTIPALVYFKDNNLKYRLVNDAYIEFVDKPSEEIVGSLMEDIIPDYMDKEEYDRYERQVLRTGQPIYNLEERVLKNGEPIWIATNLAAVSNAKGEIIGLVGISWDITQARAYQNQLENAKEQAEEGTRAKSEFLANMSHEIRTPLNGIIGMSHILAQSDLSKKQKEHLRILISSGDTLLALINDILDFSKIEAGKIEFDERDFEIAHIIDEVQNVLSIRAEEKSLSFSFETAENLPPRYNGDEYRLKQVILNLCNNAIKFTEKGSVKVFIEALDATKTHQQIKCTVKDTGIGIAKERLEQLFTAFTQADTSMTKQYEGTGLGLSISQKLIEMMEGEIGVESSLGEGSSFWFTAFLKNPISASTNKYNTEEQDAPSSSKSNLVVLLAEDNMVNQKIASYNLKQLGYTVEVANNGAEAVDKFKKNDYHFILMDIQMPIMNGHDATKEIRRLEEEMAGRNHTPIVALTANAMRGDMERCFAVGMDAYLSKPFKAPDLLNVLKEYILKD